MAAPTEHSSMLRLWYQGGVLAYLLLPLSFIYFLLSIARKLCYRLGLLSSYRAPVPVIVVGNITVGGTGKTPLVIALVQWLQQQGYKPGVISRGYGSKAPHYPFSVAPDSPPEHSGDEPLLIASRTQAPVVIDANRKQAIMQLLNDYECNIIVSDDGLQHYAMARDIELVVVDGQRGFGNGLLMPAGPLRESVSRLQQVDYVVCNGSRPESVPETIAAAIMCLEGGSLMSLDGSLQCQAAEWFASKRVHAIAGIGNPKRFYQSLIDLGFEVIEHSFPDHYPYRPEDIQFDDELPIIMTEKDAVKIKPLMTEVNLCGSSYWYLPVSASFDSASGFPQVLVDRLMVD